MSSPRKNTGTDQKGIKQNLIKLKVEKREPAQQAAESRSTELEENRGGGGGGRPDRRVS